MSEALTPITSLHDVQPGDIALGPIGGLVGLGVGLGQLILGESFRVGTMSIRHARIVVKASEHLPPGTVRHRESGTYYAPGEHGERPWRDLPMGSYDTYSTGVQTAPVGVEAMPSGARRVDMMMHNAWTPDWAYFRLAEDYPGQAEDAAAVALAMLGTPYSPASYLALSAWRLGFKAERLERWIDRRREPVVLPLNHPGPRPVEGVALPAEAICSVLVDQAWSLAGKRVMEGVPRQVVTPGALARRLLEMDSRGQAMLSLPQPV